MLLPARSRPGEEAGCLAYYRLSEACRRASLDWLADGVRFELTEGLHLRRFSRPVHSTALPSIRCGADSIIRSVLIGLYSGCIVADDVGPAVWGFVKPNLFKPQMIPGVVAVQRVENRKRDAGKVFGGRNGIKRDGLVVW